MTKLSTNCDLTWMKLSVKYITARKLLKIMYCLNYPNVKGPLVIRFVHGRTSYDVLFLHTPFQERHKNLYENFLPLIQFSRHAN